MTYPANRSALILIDIQESFRQMPFWSETDLPAFREAVLTLDAGCRARDVPVVHIYHVGAAGPFTEASGHVRGLDWLPEPCVSCDEKEKDFGGCRCQAFLLTGDAGNTDPACGRSPHHARVREAVDTAARPLRFRKPLFKRAAGTVTTAFLED